MLIIFLSVSGNALNFEVDKNMAFEIPLTNVSHTTTNKNEVTLEFHQNDDAAVSLMELRFHIPSELEKDVVQDFYKNVMSKADIIQATGDAIVTFDQVQCLTPRFSSILPFEYFISEKYITLFCIRQ